MNVQEAARIQLGLWHGVMDGMVKDAGQDVANKNLDGATITSIASIYAHVVFGEDSIVQGMLQGKQPIFVTQGWDKKLSVAPPESPALNPDWGKKVQMDIPAFQQYAKDVYAQTEGFLSNVSDEDLQKKVQSPVGEQTVGWAIAAILATHAPQHAGEIAALKGVQGLKGLPF